MGKLIEKLQQVSQSGGGGMGFFGRAREAERKARPAAVLVSLGVKDVAAVEAVAKQGADAVIVTGWTPQSADLSAIKNALASSPTIYGVELAANVSGDGVLKAAQEAGASFAVLPASAPARILYEEVEQFDRVVTLDLPGDDMGLLLLRTQSLLPAQVALMRLDMPSAALANLSVADYAKLRLVAESLRFPLLVVVKEAAEQEATSMLARLGVDGIVLAGAGMAAATLGAQVQAVREALEHTPVHDKGDSSVSLGGLMSAAGTSLTPPTRREPEREPDPEHE
ncbi:MAG: hypothetical protein ABI068_00390 [Ktedonobacterales bacterium]